MSLINTFAFETVVNQNLMKVDKVGQIGVGPVKLKDLDCKIKWDSWTDWSECMNIGPQGGNFRGGDGFYGKIKTRQGEIERPSLGNGKPCPTETGRDNMFIQAINEGYAEGFSYHEMNGKRFITEIKLVKCTRPEPEESEESEESEEADDVTEQGEQDGEADDTAEGEEEEETVTTTTVSTSGQVSPQCPDNSTYDEDEKMCRCDLGYTLDESTGQCNRNTLGFLLDAKWWILSAAGAGGAYLYHRSR